MLSSLCTKKTLLISVLLLFAVTAFAQEEIDTDVHAVLLLNKAKSKHQYHTNSVPGPGNHSAKLRSYRNSDIAAQHQTGSGGVSIGNISPAPGTNRQHSTTVIIQGHVINAGK